MTDRGAALAAAVSPRIRLVLALLAGAAGALSHAPYAIAPFILVPLVAGAWLMRSAPSPRAALWSGWSLGFAYFVPTLSWITEPFQVDAAVTGWMAPFALVLLGIGMGLFWGLALAFARWAGGGVLALVAGWTGTEAIRAHLFTGFPWASPPQALVDGLAGQGLALAGPFGMMAVLAAVAALVARARFAGAVVALGAVAAILAPVPFGPAEVTGRTVRLVQPNAPQDEKWDPDRVQVFVNRQIDYAAAGPVPDLVLLPETALPYLAEVAQPVFEALAQAARGAPVMLGIQRRSGGDYYNSLVTLDRTGRIVETYDKHHLVPFGEFMPLPGLFRRINVSGLAERADGGFASGPGPALVDLGPVGRALPLICYEVVFSRNTRGAPGGRPDLLVNLTNDAWFGMRSGPQQHLAQARMRTIEQGLPMLRAANTGISGVIDPRGRVLDSLPLNTAGFLDVPVPAALPPTLYARIGDLPILLMLIVAAIALILRRSGSAIDDGGREA